MKTCSTREAAEAVGISWITLRRWLAARKTRPSQGVPLAAGPSGGGPMLTWRNYVSTKPPTTERGVGRKKSKKSKT